MKVSNNSNNGHVSWQKGIILKNDDRPIYEAKKIDIDNFRKDGVVLIRGIMCDGVENLRHGFQRNTHSLVKVIQKVSLGAFLIVIVIGNLFQNI